LLAGLASLVIIVGGGLHLTTTNAAAAESTRACTVLDQVRLTSAVADICGGCAECTFDGDCNGTCTCC
jgi:hypothetical protein